MHVNILWKADVYFLNNSAIMYKIVETLQAPVPENTDDNLTRHHLEPMMQQEINDIGKFSTTS